MKTMKLFITLIGMLFLFNSSVFAVESLNEKPLIVEKWMSETLYNIPEKEIIYVDNLFEFTLISRIIGKAQELFPSEFENVEIVIEFGKEMSDAELELEDWMSKPLVIKEEHLELEDWMTEPFKIN
jgi:hypothetical protein